MEKPVVTGVTHRLDEARLTIERMPSDIQSMSQLFDVLAARDIYIDMISQESVDNGRLNVSVTVPDEQSGIALEILRELAPELGATGVSVERGIAKVSVVGIGMRYHTGVAARVFKRLADEKINVQMVNTSEIKMSVLVAREQCELAVRALHAEFVGDMPAEPAAGQAARR